MIGNRGRMLAAVTAAMLVAGACSGAKSDNEAAKVEAGDSSTTTAAAGEVTPAPGDTVAPGSPATVATATKTPTASDARAGSGTGTRTGTAKPSGGSTAVTPGGSGGPPVANLFSASEDRIGISDKQITLCTHAALTYAQAFDTRPEDLNVYWQMVKDSGGIFGRNVVASYEDDAYKPDQAVVAAQACKDKNPFILMGGIGFDQIPAVRNFAETNHLLYIHHIARQDLNKKFSYSYLPTVEKVGEMFAEYLIKNHKGKKIGAIWRQSEFWEPGHKGFRAITDRNGLKMVADLPVQKDQAVYANQVSELKAKGAEVVWIWENALVAAEFIHQARAQNFAPKFVVFPFNTTLETVTQDESTNPTIEGLATWPAYTKGQYGGPYAPYADEMKKFEAAYGKYRSGIKTNDILWMTWLANKQIHHLLTQCGADCTRNKVAGLMLSGQHAAISPLCPVDFKRNGHVGGFTVSAYESFKLGTGAAWRETAACKEHFI